MKSSPCLLVVLFATGSEGFVAPHSSRIMLCKQRESPPSLLWSTTEERSVAEEREFIEKELEVNLQDLERALEEEAELAAEELMDETCEVDDENMGEPADELCLDESKRQVARNRLKSIVKSTMKMVRLGTTDEDDEEQVETEKEQPANDDIVVETKLQKELNGKADRGNASAFALQVMSSSLKPSKLRQRGASDQEIKAAAVDAATLIRDGLAQLKPKLTEAHNYKMEQQERQQDSMIDMTDLVQALEEEAEQAANELLDETCEVETDEVLDEVCIDESKMRKARKGLKNIVKRTMKMLRLGTSDEDIDEDAAVFSTGVLQQNVPEGEILELGWERRGNSSALRRNGEVWAFALRCVFRALKPRKLRKKGAPEEEFKAAATEAATYIRDGLLELGPTFVKLGQVVSTRTDVLPPEYTDVLKTLQDDVPGFSGERAKVLVSKELGKPCDSVFQDFSPEPLAAASLGQVHTATYKGKKVAIKVQRAGLKKLFDVDLKNLKKLAKLLDKFDPKTDGADRNWVSIYEESERLLYLEIDYLSEADNTERFAKDFADVEWVRVPEVFREVTTPRVLTMEFVESFKLTDVERIEKEGLDRKLLAKRTADAFLRQIVETAYFHCDPHAGNLCVDTEGNLVYYDFGMMDELKPNVRSGFRKFCTALFAGGPTVSDGQLATNAKMLVDGVEEAGVLARGADRLAVEKLARYFMRTFKDNQLGKKGANIKETVGTDLQTLTENNVFRFPSTFTFIFRAFASIEGIGKGLDEEYDIGKLAQPFIENFTEAQKGYTSEAEKNFDIFKKATGLNRKDIETAVTSPKKIAYIEETLRSMEDGSLKVRVRSLENEKALERMGLTQGRKENLLVASLLLKAARVAKGPVGTTAALVGALYFVLQAVLANTKIKKFDKTQAKFVQTKFEGDD